MSDTVFPNSRRIALRFVCRLARFLITAPMVLATCASVLAIQTSAAQAPDPDSLYRQISNQLGVLQYCIGKGFPSQGAAVIYESFLASLPAPADPATAAHYRKKGTEGVIYNGEDSQIAVEQMAEGVSQTLPEYCKSYDENAEALKAAQ
ncbi:hypothetical protein [Aureimonas sp. AU20]|uniref:hypothetical protein n=1 Tax=Aureimonas sp. AU20 TaxID=1349819 RepID=UPI0007229708|nr:hypothetical protein [Aureimonas sp. AU20]ALN72566.1 hypothetical protein M673_07555 [Aureimonas sp. AU20]